MAFYSGFFNSKGLDRTYTAEDFTSYLSSIICNGILDTYGQNFKLTAASSGLKVNLGTGKAWIDGHYFVNDARYSIDLTEYQDESLPRYVAIAILLDVGESVRSVSLEITPGTPAENPSLPSLPSDENKTRLLMYAVRLNPGATELTERDWYDYREDKNVCGYCKCILGKCKVTELMSQMAQLVAAVQENNETIAELTNKVDTLQTEVDDIIGGIVEIGTCGENIHYVLYENGKLLLHGTGETYDYQIGQSPFWENEDIRSLVVSDGITKIGNSLFERCKSMALASFPTSLTKIGERAFFMYDQGGLTALNLPATVTNIGEKKQIGSLTKTQEVRRLRVAAYCRVSTDFDEQATSYQTQIEHYEEVINKNPDWIFAGIFADDGISATSTKGREQFNNMIQACHDGKIDMIITKSISRFARNTVDCLNYIRELKGLNIPIYFEKESINTMDAKGEVLITIMASLAQQESESLSQNVKLGIQYRFQQGKVMVNANSFLGYDKNVDGQLIINPEEAETVKRIFREYLEGSSCKQIAQGLERDGVLTARGSKRWHDSCIKRILENEKYMGDALLQKTYTADFLKKKRVRNNGDVPQYYVEDDHEPIIPKELFLKTQEEMSRRGKYVDCLGRNRAFSSMHCFSGLIYCSECGSLYRRIHWNNRGRKVHVWRCITRLENSTECRARTVNENALTNAFVIAVNKLIATNDSYIEVLQKNIATVIETADPDSGESIQARIDELQQQILEKSDRNEDFDAEAQEILWLRQQKENASPNDISSEDMERIRKLQTFITKMPSAILDFDESLVKHLLEKITVFEDKLEFEFKSGITIVIEN